jgi:hypothetical protein
MADDDLPQPEKLPQEQPTSQEPKPARWPGYRKGERK